MDNTIKYNRKKKIDKWCKVVYSIRCLLIHSFHNECSMYNIKAASVCVTLELVARVHTNTYVVQIYRRTPQKRKKNQNEYNDNIRLVFSCPFHSFSNSIYFCCWIFFSLLLLLACFCTFLFYFDVCISTIHKSKRISYFFSPSVCLSVGVSVFVYKCCINWKIVFCYNSVFVIIRFSFELCLFLSM